MTDNRIRLLCVGLGGMGRHDWGSAAKVPDFEVVAGVDVVEKSCNAFHEETGAPVFPDFEEALNNVEADAALISAPDAFHAPYTIRALEKGLDVICEKPMAETLEDARAMHETAERHGRMLMIHHQLRWEPTYHYLNEAVGRGDIGTPRHMDFDMFVYSDVCLHGYRSQVKHLMLQDLAIHHFDLMRFIVGQDVASVYVRSWPANEEHVDISATTNVHGALELAGPVSVSYRSSMRSLIDSTGYGCRMEIVGSRGCLRATDGTIECQTFSGHGKQEPPRAITPERTADHNCWQAFADAIRTRKPTLTDSADNLESIKVLFAAIESAETGRVISCRD
jgi:predicted dehydrogenase